MLGSLPVVVVHDVSPRSADLRSSRGARRVAVDLLKPLDELVLAYLRSPAPHVSCAWWLGNMSDFAATDFPLPI